MNHLKDVIKAIKFKFSLNQSEIADKIGVRSTYLSDMINERVPLSELFTTKLERNFGINADFLKSGMGPVFLEKELVNEQPSTLNEPSSPYRTNLSNDVDLREIFEMMKKLVDSNAKLSEGIENVTQSNKILAQNSNKIADSIYQITESNAELTHTNQLLAQSNAELISKYAGRGMDAQDAKVADVG